MSRIHLIPAQADLIGRVLDLLPSDPAALSSSLIVFPGKRPAHFLRKALADRLGRSYLPPRITTMESFVELIAREELGIVVEETGELDALEMLFALHRATEVRIGGEHLGTLETFLPLGRRLFAALEELHAERVTVARLREACGSVQFENGNRVAGLYEEFYARLAAVGGCTRAMKQTACAVRSGELRLAGFGSIILAGLYSFTSAEREIVKRLLQLEQTHLVVQDGPGIHTQLRGIGVESAPLAPAPLPADVRFYRGADTHGEVFGLARLLDGLMQEGAVMDERTVIVLHSPDALFPVVQWVLPLVPVHNISLGYPVMRTPVFGFLSGVMQAVLSMSEGNMYAPDYLRCVLHPYVKNIRWEGSSGPTRILFHTIEEFLAREWAWTFFRLENLEADSALAERCAAAVRGAGLEVSAAAVRTHLTAIHDATLRRLAGAGNLGDASRRCIDMLSFIAENSTARLHGLFRQCAVEAIERLERVASSRLGAVRTGSPAGYCTLLRILLEDTVVPFHGTPLRGMQVLGPLETRMLHFDRVIMLDANDDLVPGGGDVDPLLPPRVRRLLGIPGRSEQEEAAAYHFSTLLSGAREVHLFYREGGKKEKSRFLEQLLWERERRRGSVDQAQDVTVIDRRVDLASEPPREVGKTPEAMAVLRSMHFSATGLDAYLRCPLRFYYAHVLGLSKREEVGEDIDRATLGNFVHDVLAGFHRRLVGKQLTAGDLDPVQLDGIIASLFEQRFGRDATGPRLLTRLQVQGHLREYLRACRTPQIEAQRTTVLAVEERMRTEHEGFRFIGKADHIERRGEFTWILDYKTGKNAARYAIRFGNLVLEDRASWPVAIGSLQLPLYAMLYAGMTGESLENLRPAYVMLGQQTLGPEIEHGLYPEGSDLLVSFRSVQQVIVALVREITDPSIGFIPASDLRRECPGCAFQQMCGTTWVRRRG